MWASLSLTAILVFICAAAGSAKGMNEAECKVGTDVMVIIYT